MTSSSRPGGFLHEACLYGSDDGFVESVGGFVEDAVAGGEKVILALPDRQADLIRREIPESRHAAFVLGDDRYLRPAVTIETFLKTVRSHAARSSNRLRVVGSVFDPARSAWDPWARYEAAINELFAGYRLWGLCLYDTRSVADEVLEEVERTHPYLRAPGGHSTRSAGFQPARAFLGDRPAPRADPLESTAPEAELVNPTAGRARRAVVEAAAGSRLAPGKIADLVQGVSEIVTNAHLHGEPPIVLRLWSTDERVVATMHDSGGGPADPFAGLTPARPVGQGAGLGLWLAHKMCAEVVHTHSQDGFTVRLVAR